MSSVDPRGAVTLEELCQRLRALHVPGRPLVLPNAWDVPSARAVVAAGFPVVATTSGGIAQALGYEDEERAPAAEMFAAAARIVRSVEVPVTVDAESGYGLSSDQLVDALLDAGAAGCNLEDTDHKTGDLVETGRQAERISAVRRAASARKFALVINARVDVFLANYGDEPEERLVDGIARAKAYHDAGADCVYPIFLRHEGTIREFVSATRAPVNILALPKAPTISRLGELGVARVSYGSLIQHRLFQHLGTMLAEIHG